MLPQMIVCEIALIWSFIWEAIEMHFYMHSIGEILGFAGFSCIILVSEMELALCEDSSF